jgi:spermidine synthase
MAPGNLKILAYETTPLGVLCLRRRELLASPGTVITEITLDHELLMSSHNTASERALANEALARHAGPEPGRALSVLVGGLGLGYTAHAALQAPDVGRVDVIEFLPPVIGFLKDGLVPLSSELRSDPRFAVRQGDVFQTLWDAPLEHWDVVLIDVDHSPDEQLGDESQSFYSRAGLDRARQHLKPNGVIAVWSYAENSAFADDLRTSFARVDVVPVQFSNDLVGEELTDWLFIASDSAKPVARSTSS